MKYILILLLIPMLSKAQLRESSAYIITGGITLTVGAVLTPNETRFDATSMSYKPKGLFEQGAKSMAFIGGLGITFTGLITSFTRKKYGRY